VNHGDLVTAQSAAKTAVSKGVREKMIAEDQLSEIFGIDIDTGAREAQPPVKKRAGRPKTVPEKEKITNKIPPPLKPVRGRKPKAKAERLSQRQSRRRSRMVH